MKHDARHLSQRRIKSNSMKTETSTCLSRQAQLQERFSSLADAGRRYDFIMEMGRELGKNSRKELAVPKYLVKGCQSEVFLCASLVEGKVIFASYSEALISTGLVALLFFIYQAESPETILTCPPTCFEHMGIHASLTPGRSNGLSSIYLRMKQEALRLIVKTSNT